MIKERTKTVTLTFYRSELLYDIKNVAYVAGDVLSDEAQHTKHQLQDIGEDGNVDWVTRQLDLAMAYIVETLYPYSKTDVEDVTTGDDTFEEKQAYVVNLLVPDDFSQTTVELLRNLIHNLLVYRVLMDWMTIVGNTDGAAAWAAKVQGLEEEISGALTRRRGRVRKSQTPF